MILEKKINSLFSISDRLFQLFFMNDGANQLARFY
jgi:hypothetical protein